MDIGPLQQDINSLSSRLRMEEERYSDLRRRLQFVENQMLQNQKRSSGDIKGVHEDISEMKRGMTEIQNRLVMLIKELQLTARKQDLEVLQKYIDMWNPVNFVSAVHCRKIVAEELAKLTAKKEPDQEEVPEE